MLVASVFTFILVRHVAHRARHLGFTMGTIQFDETMGDKKPTPQIPSSWRFVGVSNGEKANSNNLWFQDDDGTIYSVQGFTTHRDFILQKYIQKLNTAQ
jgi:hypothetical protein